MRVYNWSDYIAPETLEKFTERTGIEVTYDVYDSNEILDAALLSGRSGYDVVVPSTYFTRQLKAGVFQPLNHELLPNLDNLNPELMANLETIDQVANTRFLICGAPTALAITLSASPKFWVTTHR